MPGEKKRASEEMIEGIFERSSQAVDDLDHGQERQLESVLDSYKLELDQNYIEKTSQLKRHYQSIQKGLEHNIRYENLSELRKFRTELLNEFEQSLRNSLSDYRMTEDYTHYLEDKVSEYAKDEKAVIYLDVTEIEKLNDKRVQTKKLPLGGIIIEDEHYIYDFSLENKLEQMIKEFIQKSELWIGSER